MLDLATNPGRFVPAADTFHAPEDNPANSCYCHDRLCLPSGVFDIGIGCKVITLASIASIVSIFSIPSIPSIASIASVASIDSIC